MKRILILTLILTAGLYLGFTMLAGKYQLLNTLKYSSTGVSGTAWGNVVSY